jgi:hypothetical protein
MCDWLIDICKNVTVTRGLTIDDILDTSKTGDNCTPPQRIGHFLFLVHQSEGFFFSFA